MKRKRASRFSIQLLDAVCVDLNGDSVNSVFLAENGRSGTTRALLVNHRSEDRYVFELLSQGCSVLTLREKPVAAGRITLSVAIRKVMEISGLFELGGAYGKDLMPVPELAFYLRRGGVVGGTLRDTMLMNSATRARGLCSLSRKGS